MVPDVSSIVLFSNQPERIIVFYRSVGIQFDAEEHGDGFVHAATDVGDVHMAVFPADASARSVVPRWREGGSTFVGFYVDSLDETLEALQRVGTKLLADHEVREWGCRVVVEDPDGRAVEINQRSHCGGAEHTG
jgi:lactoylglutathione lyase